jgi:hypothetical protein
MARSAAAQGPTAWELSPYRIKLVVAVEPGGGLLEEEVNADLAARATSVVGGSWRVEARPPEPALRYKMLRSLSTLAESDLPANLLDGDKVLLVGVRQADGKFAIEARELDVLTRLWNTIIRAQTPSAAGVPAAALEALLRAFAPLGRIESADGKTATVRLRGAALARRDRDLPALQPGAAFRPVLLKSDASGVLAPGSAEVLGATFLSPTGMSGASVNCRIEAGTGSPAIPDYHPHRQRLALAISPGSDSTLLKLVSRGEASAPLEGYDVLDGQQLLGRSNRRGVVQIPAGKEAVRMLTIRRGDAVLARLPVAVGHSPEITVPLSADEGSLAIEAQVAVLEDALVDLVARRQVLAARIRAAAKRGDMAGGQALLTQLRTLPADALAGSIDQAQQSLGSASAAAQERLRAKLDSLKQLLDKFRSESPADMLETELKSAAPAP